MIVGVMTNPLSFRVCGDCSILPDYTDREITDIFENTYYRCKICGQEKLDGCYMLFAHDSEDHNPVFPYVGITGFRQTGKTRSLISKMKEFEMRDSLFYIVVPYENRKNHLISEIHSNTEFEVVKNFVFVDPNKIEEWFRGIREPDRNIYVDEIQNLSDNAVTEISIACATGRAGRLFFTKTRTALDILMERAHMTVITHPEPRPTEKSEG